MKTEKDIAAEYTLDENGTVQDFGKFEGEPAIAVALWDCAMNGFSDFERGNALGFKIDRKLREVFPLSIKRFKGKRTIWVFEDSQGFVYAR